MTRKNREKLLEVAHDISNEFASLRTVEAVTLGGSLSTGNANHRSDIDLYVYFREQISTNVRYRIISERAIEMQLDNSFWEIEDYWYERETGIKVEAMYRHIDWPEAHLKDLFANARAQMGCSTSMWHNISTSLILYDRNGRAASLKASAMEYPDSLVTAIINKNYALLRGSMAAHPEQIINAMLRKDTIFMWSRVVAFLDSYFDVLFALNRTLHPGSKRQLQFAQKLKHKPGKMRSDIESLFQITTVEQMRIKLEDIVDRLTALLAKHHALPVGAT